MSSGAEPGRGLWVDGGLVVAGPGAGGVDWRGTFLGNIQLSVNLIFILWITQDMKPVVSYLTLVINMQSGNCECSLKENCISPCVLTRNTNMNMNKGSPILDYLLRISTGKFESFDG